MRLYSYCLRFDDGAAPNPYWKVCTLVICKPAIRRTAEKGDWVVGLGSVNSPLGNISASVVYAMKVSEVVSLQKYDQLCKEELGGKIPELRHKDFRKRVGDCIYEFTKPQGIRMRESVHNEGNRVTDLGGKNALLSSHFFYFGDSPIPLPQGLRGIIHQTQGHKSRANAEFVKPFVSWLEGAGFQPNHLYGEPQLKAELMNKTDCRGVCATRDRDDDENDREF